MKTMFVSQPMAGRTTEEIRKERNEVKKRFEGSYEIADTLFEYTMNDDKHDLALYKLGDAIMKMATCDTVCFVTGWEKARGCRIEHMCAELYDKKIIHL